MKTYSELITFRSYEKRLEYLKLSGKVGEYTFGGNRYLNQRLYTSREWKDVRNEIILRDNSCDLGIPGYELNSGIYVHHINPIMVVDLIHNTDLLFDLENLICCSRRTHEIIHYGSSTELLKSNTVPAQRTRGDTILW